MVFFAFFRECARVCFDIVVFSKRVLFERLSPAFIFNKFRGHGFSFHHCSCNIFDCTRDRVTLFLAHENDTLLSYTLMYLCIHVMSGFVRTYMSFVLSIIINIFGFFSISISIISVKLSCMLSTPSSSKTKQNVHSNTSRY